MRSFLLCLLFLVSIACKNSSSTVAVEVPPKAKEADSLAEIADFKILDSKHIDNALLWQPFEADLKDFSEKTYKKLAPLILDKDIPTLQAAIRAGKLSYENLVKFYLYRIRLYDRMNPKSLNAVISLNPNVIAEARQKDRELNNKMRKHELFGMPILLKDNIGTDNMPTTAGAVAFQNNKTGDAFIVQQLKENGALILGKANLSEWAYFFCENCPSGYSAVGGQTLNPYGRKTVDTGGSSSGSGVAVAANFCVAAVGTETSGSILSPASQNSAVGLKPTVGLLSRSGIIPISSTLDTPGPMTKNVIDTAILLDAMTGYDATDVKATANPSAPYFKNLNTETNTLKDKRFGVFTSLLSDPLYAAAIADLKTKGAVIVEIDAPQIGLPDFLRLLNLDMKRDFLNYTHNYSANDFKIRSIEDVLTFNASDSLARMPYGQKLLRGVATDVATEAQFDAIKKTLKSNGRLFFDKPMQDHDLDGIVSKNNFHAGYAAVAEYPAITVPMGYTEKGQPEGLTFISKPFSELQLLQWAYDYEQVSKKRVPPYHYE